LGIVALAVVEDEAMVVGGDCSPRAEVGAVRMPKCWRRSPSCGCLSPMLVLMWCVLLLVSRKSFRKERRVWWQSRRSPLSGSAAHGGGATSLRVLRVLRDCCAARL
jgi:hypothetical protein